MFSGIVESLGEVVRIRKEESNVHFTLSCSFTHELKIDQSVAHNGCCLTVVRIEGDEYTVTAIDETLQKTNLGSWKVGSLINLERCIRMNDRLDGHIVQGHVDTTGTCTGREDLQGSWKFSIQFDPASGHITVPKGSICINGVSLTVVDSHPGEFSVHIIPYTFEHTNFQNLFKGDQVNLEFDIIGKYIAALMERR